MNAPKSSEEKKLSRNSKSEKIDNWLKKIDYWRIIQKAGNLFWENKKRLITIAILLTVTGGQAITFNSSFGGNMGNGGSGINENQPAPSTEENQDWRKTLDEIENREQLKIRLREFTENKQKLYGGIAIAAFVLAVTTAILIAVFFLNCYFHLLFVNTVKHLDNPSRIILPRKNIIKEKIRGRWKKLAAMRVIFGLIYLGSLVLFILPTAFFVWQESWPLAIAFGGFSLIAILAVFIIISYVFRYSLFYLALTKISVKKSIDCGYDLFSKFWKESVLTSLINFALGVIAAIAAVFVLFASLVILTLAALIVGFIIYLVVGLAHAEGIAIGVGIVIVLIPLIIVGLVLAAAWQGFVVIFWYLIFNEVAGCKVPEPEKKPVLAKEKKKPAPVVQKGD